jgi:hypothetical protein
MFIAMQWMMPLAPEERHLRVVGCHSSGAKVVITTPIYKHGAPPKRVTLTGV